MPFAPVCAFSIEDDVMSAFRHLTGLPVLPTVIPLSDAAKYFGRSQMERSAQGPIFRHLARSFVETVPLLVAWNDAVVAHFDLVG